MDFTKFLSNLYLLLHVSISTEIPKIVRPKNVLVNLFFT